MRNMNAIATVIAIALAAVLGIAISAHTPETPAIATNQSNVCAVPISKVTVPASPLNSDQEIAQRAFTDAWNAAKDNFLWSDRLHNWQAWNDKFSGKLKDVHQAEAAVDEMLRSLNDKYTRLNDAASTAKIDILHDQRDVVDAKALPNGLGYIRIHTFGSRHTAVEMEDALRQLRGAKGLVIDLRDNKGGNVDEAFKIFAMLVKDGTFTTIKGQQKGTPYTRVLRVTAQDMCEIQNRHDVERERPPLLADKKPLTVLVNGNTASAAEMLAGALRDERAATIVGSQTFGKGIVQQWFKLTLTTSVQISVGQYYLPKGDTVQDRGIKPDLPAKSSKTSDTELETAIQELLKKMSTESAK